MWKSVHRSVLSDLQTRKESKKGAYPLSPRFTGPRFTSPRFTSPVQSSPVQSTKYRMPFFLADSNF